MQTDPRRNTDVTLREAVGNSVRLFFRERFFGDELKSIREGQRLLALAYQVSPVALGRDEVITQLQETVDPSMWAWAIDMLRNWEPLTDGSAIESYRVTSITDARNLYLRDVVVGHIVDLWTDFGFGVNVDVVPRGENDDITKEATEVWDKFWLAPRNKKILGQRNIHKLSTTLLNDGEVIFVAFVGKKTGGEVTIRTVPTEQITEVIHDPDDEQINAYYKRVYTPSGSIISKTIYYKDWLADEALVARARATIEKDASNQNPVYAEDVEENTDVVAINVMHKEKYGRGWPLLTAAAPWARVYRDFAQDRASLASAVAMFVDSLKVKGGQRAVNAVQQRLQSSLTSTAATGETNPKPPAGATWIENEAATRSRLPLSTGAGDAYKDGTMLINQVLLPGRLFPHYAGYGDAYRLATATAMELPILRAFERYQTFWSSVFTDLANLVFWASDTYGQTKFQKEIIEVDVNTDAVIKIEISDIATLFDRLQASTEIGIPLEITEQVGLQLLRVALQNLGVRDVDTILTPPDGEDPDDDQEELDVASLQKIWEETKEGLQSQNVLSPRSTNPQSEH